MPRAAQHTGWPSLGQKRNSERLLSCRTYMACGGNRLHGPKKYTEESCPLGAASLLLLTRDRCRTASGFSRISAIWHVFN